MSPETFFSILGWIVTGAVAGYVSGILLKAERSGCIVKIGIGIAGAFVGGFVMNFIMPGGLFPNLGFFNQIVTATIGAILLLIILEIVLPGKQLGVDDDRRRKR